MYFTPPIAVHGPKPISMCQHSLYFGGGGDGLLFFLRDFIVATSPGSIRRCFGRWEILTDPSPKIFRFRMSLSTFRCPTACCSTSCDITLVAGSDELTLYTGLTRMTSGSSVV